VRTRREAVEHLKQRGLHAAERNWSLGKTVLVAVGGKDDGEGGITVFERMMFIVPKAKMWTSLELDRPRPDDDDEVSLDVACERVERILMAPSDHPQDKRR
jgi:hypothetical protein